MKCGKRLSVACAGMLSFALATANAATITQFGTDIKFTYDDATQFGTGTVVGNNIFFNPTGFVAESLNGAGLVNSDPVGNTINITVEATTENYVMDMFNLVENGDYKLNDLGGAASYVTAQAEFKVTSETNLFGCGGLCQDTKLFNAGVLPDTGGALALWSMGGSIDLADTTNWGTDTKVQIQIQNNLSAFTDVFGEEAFIQKKFGAVGIQINPIPVPAAVWLFGSGLLGLVGMARRKKT